MANLNQKSFYISISYFALLILPVSLSAQKRIEYKKENDKNHFSSINFFDQNEELISSFSISKNNPFKEYESFNSKNYSKTGSKLQSLAPKFIKEGFDSRFLHVPVSSIFVYPSTTKSNKFPIVSYTLLVGGKGGGFIGIESKTIVLDSLGDIKNEIHLGRDCTRPVISEDGKYLAFVSHGLSGEGIEPSYGMLNIIDLFSNTVVFEYQIPDRWYTPSRSQIIDESIFFFISTNGNRKLINVFDMSTNTVYEKEYQQFRPIKEYYSDRIVYYDGTADYYSIDFKTIER